MVLFTNYYEGFFVPTFVQNGKTVSSSFACHSENLDKIFTVRDCPYKFSEINVLSELKVK